MGVYVELRGHVECDRCGESHETIWALENGRKSITTTETLLKIAHALGKTVDEIFCL